MHRMHAPWKSGRSCSFEEDGRRGFIAAGVNRSDFAAPGDLGGFCRKGHVWLGAGGTADQRTGTESQACGALQAQIWSAG